MPQFIIPADLLLSIVKAAASHAEDFKSQSVIRGILIDVDDNGGLHIVSTDGYRLFMRTIEASEQIDGMFPNYKQILPSEYKVKVSLNRKALMNAVKIMPGKLPMGCPIKLTFNGKCEIEGTDKQGNTLNQTLPLVGEGFDGEPLTVILNSRMLHESLAALDSAATVTVAKQYKLADVVTVELNGPTQAVMFSVDNTDIPTIDRDATRSLLMPVLP